MAKLLVYYAHPGQHYSLANREMAKKANNINNISFVDLYAKYPRFDISVEEEQQLLLEHDVVLFQFPVFWYSCPSLVKEWMDLVLQHGFAYGAGGDKLSGKTMMLALTAAGSKKAYSRSGYQNFTLRTFFTPFEQTARLCDMNFAPPYVLFGAVRSEMEQKIGPHISGYMNLLKAIRDDAYDFDRASKLKVVTHDTLPIGQEV